MTPAPRTSAAISAYLRALAVALHAAAPASPHPPLHEALALLYALDPAVSGEVLAPAAIDPTTGMPAWAWVERVQAERGLAAGASTAAPAADDPVWKMDPELAARLAARARLHAHLRAHAVLPIRRTNARLLREHPAVEVELTDDRVLSDGRWVRTTVVVRGAAGATDLGLARRVGGSRIAVADGVDALLGRHALSPLPALHAQLVPVARGAVVAISRGTVGPLWAPGAAWPPGIGASTADALALHLPLQTLSEAVDGERDLDPFRGSGLPAPRGLGAIHERRIALTPAGEAVARALVGDGLDRAQLLRVDPAKLARR